MPARPPEAEPATIALPARAEGGVYATIILCGLVLALHGNALRYPLVFSDLYWFSDANLPVLSRFEFGLRFITKSYAYVLVRWGGGNVFWLHASAVALHVLAVLSVFFLARRLVAAVLAPLPPTQASLIALLAAGLVALHPAHIYSVAFVGEQENVIATLFALACLAAWLEGLLRRSPWFLATAALAYAGAMLSKENLIMVPALALAMTALLRPFSWETARRIAVPAGLMAVVTLGTLGFALRTPATIPDTGYPSTQLAFMAGDGDIMRPPYAQSAVTQALHFFRYGFIWLLPDPARMALDIQLPLAPLPPSGIAWLGLGAFLLWPIACLALLFRRGWWGLAGFGLLWPWLLFLTEFATIRHQEGFVLYRLYPWLIGPSLVAALLIARLGRPLGSWATPAAGLALGASLFLIAQDRLATFATDYRLWDAAVAANQAYETTSPAPLRAYINRGNASLAQSQFDAALRDFTTATRLSPRSPEAHLNTAVALERMGQPEPALAALETGLALGSKLPANTRARIHANRAAILFTLGRQRDALTDLDRAAELDPARAEYRDNAEKLRASVGE